MRSKWGQRLLVPPERETDEMRIAIPIIALILGLAIVSAVLTVAGEPNFMFG